MFPLPRAGDDAIPPPAIGIDPPTPLSTLAAVITSTLSATATASPATSFPPTIVPPPPTDGEDGTPGECQLLGPFALWVQLALGGLALLSLVYKRWKERPQRPIKIWGFDVSKQVVGSMMVHVANVFMSMLTSGRFSIKVGPDTVATNTARLLVRGLDILTKRDGEEHAGGGGGGYVPNPCSFYLLNLAIDTTLGIPILIILLRLTTGLIARTPLGQPPASIQSGNYGTPPNWLWWSKQSLIYFIGLFGMKVCVLVIFVAFPWISRVGDWALRWTEGNERLQIVFVMMLFPLIMNAMQYYIIDSFIKKQEDVDDSEQAGMDGYHRREAVPGEDPEDGRGEILMSNEDVDQDVDDDEVERAKASRNRGVGKGSGEYDPEFDGDAPTVVGSSSSRRNAIPPGELYPKE